MQQQEQGDVTSSAQRTVIWQGVIEWVDKTKATDVQGLQTCDFSVAASVKDGEPEVKAESWPLELSMELIPKVFLENIGPEYLKNSKSLLFLPSQECDSLEPLLTTMCHGFVGCVHFLETSTCGIKILILVYTAQKASFLGFIPNDQQGMIDRLREVIRERMKARDTELSKETTKTAEEPTETAMETETATETSETAKETTETTETSMEITETTETTETAKETTETARETSETTEETV